MQNLRQSGEWMDRHHRKAVYPMLFWFYATQPFTTQNPANAGHALLMGANLAAGSIVDNVTIPAAYDYGLVVKENTGVEVKTYLE